MRFSTFSLWFLQLQFFLASGDAPENPQNISAQQPSVVSAERSAFFAPSQPDVVGSRKRAVKRANGGGSFFDKFWPGEEEKLVTLPPPPVPGSVMAAKISKRVDSVKKARSKKNKAKLEASKAAFAAKKEKQAKKKAEQEKKKLMAY